MMLNEFSIIQCLIFYGMFNPSIQTAMRGNNIRHAKDNEFPFVVSIGREHELTKNNPELTHYCTGSLITRKHVLTAEHCFEGEVPEYTYVRYGSANLLKAKTKAVQAWLTYKQWLHQRGHRVPIMEHDIAILTLKTKITEPDIIPVTPLKFISSDLYGSYAIAAGWGRVDSGGKPRHLRFARFKIISNDECEKKMYELTHEEDFLLSRFFCTQADPWTLLDCGDSGGPLLRNNLLVGINVASCPNYNDVSDHFRDELDRKQMNLHLGFHYYRLFIQNVTNDYA